MDYQDAPVIVTRTPEGFALKFIGPIHINTTWIESEFDKIVAARPKLVEMDFSQTEHISSLGLGLLVHFNTRIRSGGGVAKITKIRKLPLSVIRTSRLAEILGVAKDVEVVEPQA